MKKLILKLSLPVLMILLQAIGIQHVSGQKTPAGEDSLQVHLQKAQALVKKGEKAEASKILTGIMATHSYNKEAVQWYLIANMKRSPTGEVDAISMLDSLMKVYPSNDALLFYKVFIQSEYGMIKEAMENQEILIQRHPEDEENWIGKGQNLYSLERYQEAYDAFSKALELNSSRADVYGMKAASLGKLGKFDEAISILSGILEKSPNDPNTVYNRGCLYCLKGEKSKALADLKNAISLNPEFKNYAPTDKDFESLWKDDDFIKLTK